MPGIPYLPTALVPDLIPLPTKLNPRPTPELATVLPIVPSLIKVLPLIVLKRPDKPFRPTLVF